MYYFLLSLHKRYILNIQIGWHKSPPVLSWAPKKLFIYIFLLISIDVYNQTYNSTISRRYNITCKTKIPSPLLKSTGLITKPQKTNSAKLKSNTKSTQIITGRGKKIPQLILTEFLKIYLFLSICWPEDSCASGRDTNSSPFVICSPDIWSPQKTKLLLQNEKMKWRKNTYMILHQLFCFLHSNSHEDCNVEISFC